MVVTIQDHTILPPDIRTELEYAIRPDVGRGVGTRAKKTPLNVSDGVEFEVGEDGGVYVGSVPYDDDAPLDLEYSKQSQSADGLLYVYVADLERQKELTNGDLTARYAAMQYESEFFRSLSLELRSLVSEVFDVDADDVRFERYPGEDTGDYFVLPLSE